MMEQTIAYPTLDQIKSALFIQPHPDDNEIGAGGTIALLRKRGVTVYGLTVTLGEGGSSNPALSPEDVADLREKEAKEAMHRLDIINLGNMRYHELSVLPHERLVEDLVEVMRELKVDAVFTVDPHLLDELHPTHLQVGQAVSEAFMRCGVLQYPAHHAPHNKAYCLKMIGYYMTNRATTIVDISEVMELKMSAVMAHESQIDASLSEAIYGLAQVNALGFDFSYAEPLRLLGPMQTHCFAIPEKLIGMEKLAIFSS